MSELLGRLLQQLDRDEVRYCFLRDGHRLDRFAGGELDMLVEEGQFAQFQDLALRLGLFRVPAWGRAPHHFFIAYLDDVGAWLKLDVVTRLAYGGRSKALMTGLGTGCLASRRRCGGVCVPSPEYEIVTLLLHCVLDKEHFAAEHRLRLLDLVDQVREPDLVTALLDAWWQPGATWSSLASRIRAEDWASLIAQRRQVAARLARRAPMATWLRRLRDRLFRFLHAGLGLWRPRSLSVAVMAPDGAGKTTLIHRIARSFCSPVRVVCMGLYGNAGPAAVSLRLPGLGFAVRLLWQWGRYLTARYHQARGRLVLFDRYSYDALLPSPRPLGRLARWRRTLLGHACPAPDLVVVLDAPGHVLLARKGEHNAALLEQWRQGYRMLQRVVPRMAIIDATQRIEDVARQVNVLIRDAYACRLERGKTTPRGCHLTAAGKTLSDGGNRVPAAVEPCHTARAGSQNPATLFRGKIAYVMSRFPTLTETFILYELLAVEKQGTAVEIYPLQRERASVVHPEAASLTERAHFAPWFSLEILAAHWYFLRRKPRAYLGALAALLRGTWGSLRYFAGALVFFPKIVYFARSMAANGVTHVHAHFASHPAAAALVIRRLTGIPYSFTAHGSDLHRDRHMLREKVAEAAFVVAICQYNREWIVAECGEQSRRKIAVVHCGVDREVFRPVFTGRQSELCRTAFPGRPGRPEKAVLPSDSPNSSRAGQTSEVFETSEVLGCGRPEKAVLAGFFTVLCIGTLHEVKGQTHLIEACRILRRRGHTLRCWLVGDGPDEKALRQQALRAGLEDCVVFLGWLPRQRVADMLGRADVLVAPSVPSRDGRREGIPVVLMEAMASGVPVVASRLSGIPELVEPHVSGLLVPPGDAAAIADRLEELIQDPGLRRRLAETGRAKVIEQFDQETNAGVLAQLFVAGGVR